MTDDRNEKINTVDADAGDNFIPGNLDDTGDDAGRGSADVTCTDADDAADADADAVLFDIKAELRKLPDKPGVYIMHGPRDEIIYVGKAVNLKNRVRQYFQSSRGKTDKIKKMVSLIRRFEYIVVDSEMEALVLENNLIKENSPRYNTLLKDDKTYPYIKVTVGEAFPRILLTRKIKKDKARYFGPYTSGTAVRDTIDLLHKLFKVRSCSLRLPADMHKDRPCLYYHLGQCLAPCNGYIGDKEYRAHIDRAVDFLSGKYDYVQNYLLDKMNTASESMEFERAIEYRELLKEIESLSEGQKVMSTDLEDRDIIGIGIMGHDAVAEVFFMRNGRMIGRESVHLDVDPHDETGELLKAFIGQFYSGTPYIPHEIWVQDDVPERELLEAWLGSLKLMGNERAAEDISPLSEDAARTRTVRIITPKRGDKEKLVEMAVKNAENQLLRDFERIKREDERTRGAQESLKNILGLGSLHRIESYDISNTAGFESVGSMVVFKDGKPLRSNYRKFRIKTVTGPNDYASMREVISRRFTRGLNEKEGSFSCMPDLILMDGGKGQVHVAEEVLEGLGLSIPVAGMVKDDAHRTRGLYFHDEELPIDIHTEMFKLITRVQDETHRFAIEYHKSLRGKAQLHSVLDDIPGIGEKRRRSLLKYFKGIDAIKSASLNELSEADGMNMAAAKAVYEYLHGRDVANDAKP